MFARFQAVFVRVSKFLSEHRLASFLVTVAALALLADDVRRVLPDEGQVGVLTWVLLALMAFCPIPLVYALRRGPYPSRLLIAWEFGITPALLGITAALAGSPALVMWMGVLVSSALVGWVLATARAA
jgi:hypothetical protein